MFLRSSWEANYARFLKFLKENGEIQNWEFEPQTFSFQENVKGINSYTPDFKIYNNDGSHHWIEIKGIMDEESQIKLDLFNKFYPKEKIEVIMEDWFRKNSPIYRKIIPFWEKRIRIKK